MQIVQSLQKEKNAFSTETETPVENLKMPTLNIPDSMKNMVPEEIEVPKAPVQNNLFSDEADAAEKMKDEKPAFCNFFKFQSGGYDSCCCFCTGN